MISSSDSSADLADILPEVPRTAPRAEDHVLEVRISPEQPGIGINRMAAGSPDDSGIQKSPRLSTISDGLTKFARSMNVSTVSVLGDVSAAVREIDSRLSPSPETLPSYREIRDAIIQLLVARRGVKKAPLK